MIICQMENLSMPRKVLVTLNEYSDAINALLVCIADMRASEMSLHDLTYIIRTDDQLRVSLGLWCVQFEQRPGKKFEWTTQNLRKAHELAETLKNSTLAPLLLQRIHAAMLVDFSYGLQLT